MAQDCSISQSTPVGGEHGIKTRSAYGHVDGATVFLVGSGVDGASVERVPEVMETVAVVVVAVLDDINAVDEIS
jgi:hypothetical protein